MKCKVKHCKRNFYFHRGDGDSKRTWTITTDGGFHQVVHFRSVLSPAVSPRDFPPQTETEAKTETKTE